MKELTIDNARDYSKEKFKRLPELYRQWNMMHSKSIIKALEFLRTEDLDKKRLFALAWIHDIGKIVSEENHAKISLEILEKDFELNEEDKDCILNHGSSAVPKTKEGKVFRYADGLSLFFPEMIQFKFYAEAKEGMKFKEIKENVEKMYEKYREKYSDSEEVLEILEDLMEKIISFR